MDQNYKGIVRQWETRTTEGQASERKLEMTIKDCWNCSANYYLLENGHCPGTGCEVMDSNASVPGVSPEMGWHSNQDCDEMEMPLNVSEDCPEHRE